MSSGPARVARNSAIVLCLDDRFVAPAQAMLESIRRHGGELDGATLVVVTTGLASSATEALAYSASRVGLALAVRTVTDIGELGSVPGWAVSTCLRLYVGEICRGFERALYLDADMLILSDLTPLLDRDLGERTCAAVINHPPLSVMRVALPRLRRGSVDGDAPYFNAGVLMVDVRRWQSRSVGPRSREFISSFPTTRLLDQDALNVALVHDWCPLEKEWNTPAGPLRDAPMLRGLARMNPSILNEIAAWERTQRQPKILHFTGQPKPWEAGYPWPELRQLYYEYVLPSFGSSWPSTRPEALANQDDDQRTRGFRRA